MELGFFNRIVILAERHVPLIEAHFEGDICSFARDSGSGVVVMDVMDVMDSMDLLDSMFSTALMSTKIFLR